MRTIIVGVDGSDASLTALEWAAAISRAAEAPLVVVNAFTPVQSEKPPGVLERLLAEQRHRVETWYAGMLDDLPHDLEIVEGDPQDRLAEAADRHDADLLVVSSTGASGASPGLLRLGSVAEYLARHARIPLLIVPPESRPAFGRAVVAVDGSEHSKSAAAWVAAIGQLGPEPTQIVAVNVDDGSELDDARGAETDRETRLRLLTTDWVSPLVERGVPFEPVIVGDEAPADGILDVARRTDADLVVAGMRGAGGVIGLRLGGVAFKVLRQTTLPLVLVPPFEPGE